MTDEERREAHLKRKREYYAAHKDQWQRYGQRPEVAQRRRENMTPEQRQRSRERANQWRLANPERKRQASLDWYARTRAERHEYERQRRPQVRERERARLATDAQFLIRKRLGSRLAVALRAVGCRKSYSITKLIGCPLLELKSYLESRFLPGMSWENRSEWHIDHIRPCASFDLTDLEQQRACFHYTNLQPLWAADNHRKGAKVLSAEAS
jgi:hypothetical protein